MQNFMIKFNLGPFFAIKFNLGPFLLGPIWTDN